MKRLLLLTLLLMPFQAKADAVPGFLLDTLYQQCMKSGGTGGSDAQKQKYCLCIRNKMASWDSNTFEQLGKEMQGGSQTPPLLQEVAQQCIQETMK